MTRKNRCGGQASTQAANQACRTALPIRLRRDGLTRQTPRRCEQRFTFSFLAKLVLRPHERVGCVAKLFARGFSVELPVDCDANAVDPAIPRATLAAERR